MFKTQGPASFKWDWPEHTPGWESNPVPAFHHWFGTQNLLSCWLSVDWQFSTPLPPGNHVMDTVSGSYVIKWKEKETQERNVVYSNRKFPGLPLSWETPAREAEEKEVASAFSAMVWMACMPHTRSQQPPPFRWSLAQWGPTLSSQILPCLLQSLFRSVLVFLLFCWVLLKKKKKK